MGAAGRGVGRDAAPLLQQESPCHLQDEMLECEKELGDVLNCVRLLELHYDETEMKLKMIRWWKRIKDSQEGS